jgi:hypothetical protein
VGATGALWGAFVEVLAQHPAQLGILEEWCRYTRQHSANLGRTPRDEA